MTRQMALQGHETPAAPPYAGDMPPALASRVSTLASRAPALASRVQAVPISDALVNLSRQLSTICRTISGSTSKPRSTAPGFSARITGEREGGEAGAAPFCAQAPEAKADRIPTKSVSLIPRRFIKWESLPAPAHRCTIIALFSRKNGHFRAFGFFALVTRCGRPSF